MLEAQIEKYLNRRVKETGGLSYKFTSPAHRGVPDRIIIYYNRVYFVEVKQENGRVSTLQKIEIKKLREFGMKAFIVWSKEDVDAFISMVMEDI